MEQVLLEVTGKLATITLSRPEHLNAFTDEMEAGLLEAFDLCDADDDVRAIILTGAGRAFCAGMDLSDASATFAGWRSSESAPPDTQFAVDGEPLPFRRDGGGRVALRMFDCTKPIIAAVNGPAIGVGATILLAADLRLAAEEAKFGFVFGRRGLVLESCSTWFLPRVVPLQVAMEWALTGRVFDAHEALRGGLVRSIHSSDQLIEAALELAEEIASSVAPVSAALTRRMILAMLGAPHPMAAHEVETLALNDRGMSRDAAEGITAFLEKRAAVFTDSPARDLPDVLSHLSAPTFQLHAQGPIPRVGTSRAGPGRSSPTGSRKTVRPTGGGE